MTIPRLAINGSEDIRAIVALMLREQDIASGFLYFDSDRYMWKWSGKSDPVTMDHYLQQAQYLLESSYRNYPHPAQNLDT